MKRSHIAAGLFLLVAAAYWPAYRLGFIYDDLQLVLAQPPTTTPADVVELFAEPHYPGLPYYRPLSRLSLGLQATLHGQRPALFHLGNVVMLAGTAVMAFLLLGLPSLRTRPEWAAMAAALFALHPAASTAAYQISGREVLLGSFFSLATLAAFLHGGARAARWGTAAFAAALLSREHAVVVPALLLVADVLGLGAERPGRLTDWLRRYAPLAVVGIAYLALRGLAVEAPRPPLALLENPGETLLSFVYPLQTLFAPFWDLVYEPQRAVWLSPARVAMAAAGVALLALAVARGSADLRRLALFWYAWFVIAMAPTANVLEQESHFAERYVFFASLSVFALAAAAMSAWNPTGRRHTVAATTGGLLLVLCVVTSVHRARFFVDDLTFHERWVQTDPDVAIRYVNLASALLEVERYDEAEAAYQEALRLDPDESLARVGLARVLASSGRQVQAIAAYERVIASDPSRADAHAELGGLLIARGRRVEGVALAERALEIDPAQADAHFALGMWAADTGDLDGAIAHLRAVPRNSPRHRRAQVQLEKLEARRRRTP